jgi:signal transduction histidine kinase
MSVFGSLTNRIFLASALLAILTIGFAIFFVRARVTREAEAELARGLTESAALVEQQQRTTANQYLLVTRLVADLPKFKAAVETQDALTVRPIAEDYGRQLDADLLLVTGRQGQVLFGPSDRLDAGGLATVTRALAGSEAAAFWSHPHGILQVVTVPVFVQAETRDIFGTLTAGFLLDERRARQFRRATASDIVFAMAGRVRASTIAAASAGTPIAYGAPGQVSRVELGSEEYMVTAHPLAVPLAGGTAPAERPVALVLRSRASQLQSLRTINAALLATAALSVVLAVLLSYVVARSVTRPLGTITAAMREIAATGDLTRKIILRGPRWWQDEDARLLATTFNALTDSIGRFQREAAKRERLLSLGRLSTVVAHEVRNPLMIIKAALRSLRPGAPAAELQEAVTDIDEQVGRLNRIVNDVLDFARPLRFELSVADVDAICRDAAAAASAGDAGGPPIAVSGAPARIITDPERLRTALLNVLGNARQAVLARSAAGHEAPRAAGRDEPPILVTVTRSPSGRVRIAVRDHGTGIAPEHASRIFEPYFTTRRGGTGLGLPITRNIVEGLGGTIAVRPGNPGTTIEIELPEIAPDPPRAPAAASAEA